MESMRWADRHPWQALISMVCLLPLLLVFCLVMAVWEEACAVWGGDSDQARNKPGRHD
jgi:hypothetical protein